VGVRQVVTLSEGRYLKTIYRKQVEEGEKLTTTSLASVFGVRPATVTGMLQRLADKGLIRYKPYCGVFLTDEGITEAKRQLRKHRILEVLFVELLGFDAERACGEASKLDHYCSPHLINAICRSYNHPETCPCNKAIFRDGVCCE